MRKPQVVLIIDDDRDITAIACIRLQSAGYRVFRASDGRRGIRVAVEQSPGIILLDVRMPSLDGLETLACLRQLEETRNTPVVIFSVDCSSTRQAMMMGVQHYVGKPYHPEVLVATIEAALRCRSDKRRACRRLVIRERLDNGHTELNGHRSEPNWPRLRGATALFGS